MANKFICDGQKYELGGSKEDTIGLPLPVSGLPAKVEVGGYSLTLKDSFHVSLVCIGTIIEKNNITIPDVTKQIIADFCDFTRNTNIEFVRYRDEFKFVSEAERRSVIVMCDISNLDKFFDSLNQKYGLNLEYPPTHVTLYTLQPNLGIFLTNSDDTNRLAKNIKAPVKLSELCATNTQSF